jgi:hypothetical protein
MTTTNPYFVLGALEANHDLLLHEALATECSQALLVLIGKYDSLLRQMGEALADQSAEQLQKQLEASVRLMEVKRG